MFVPCFAVLCYVSFLALQYILMGKRELVALLYLSSWCLVALPHGAVGWSAVCIVVFSDHTRLLFHTHPFF